jgi:NAD(P)-dependent dehydrogenase (short-subunit alcohol dehydrogenase family)
VNNAGIMDYFAGVADADTDLYRKVMRVNVDGPFFLSRAACRTARGQGSIVNISSEAGIRGAAAGVIYTMSKHPWLASPATLPTPTGSWVSAATRSAPEA